MTKKTKALQSQGENNANLQKLSNQHLINIHRTQGGDLLQELLNRFEAVLEMLAHPQHHYKKDVEKFIGESISDPQQVTGLESQKIVNV